MGNEFRHNRVGFVSGVYCFALIGEVLGDAAITGGFAVFKNPREVETGDSRATLGAAFKVMENHAFGYGAGATGGDR
jgi:hypothetical protein